MYIDIYKEREGRERERGFRVPFYGVMITETADLGVLLPRDPRSYCKDI